MKKKISVLCVIILSLVNCIPTYASSNKENLSAIEESYDKEIIKEFVIHKNILETELQHLESKYDLSLNMPTEAIEKLSSIADVSKEVQKLDDTHIQITYNIASQEPVMEKTFISGNTEKIYSITNYTYIVNTSTINSGNTSETTVLSDVTFKNTVYYSFYEHDFIRMLRLDSGTTSITKFYEKDLRDLVLTAYCLGGTNDGAKEERTTKTIETVRVGTDYTLDINFDYFYDTSAAHIIYGADVTYSHGLSSYTVSSRMTLGRMSI